jgi:hypothetical protein
MTYFYEKYKLPYTLPPTFYRPDFVLPNGIILEVKGYFEPHDRKKHLLIKEQYPDLDIRFVFSNPKLRLNRTTLKTYGDWCRHHGFLYTRRTVPIEWLEEPSLKARKNAVVRCLQRRQSGERDDEASDDYGGTR